MTLQLLQTLAAVDDAAHGGQTIAAALGWEAGDIALALAHAEDAGLIAGAEAPSLTQAGYLYALRHVAPLMGMLERASRLAADELFDSLLAEAEAAQGEGAA